MKRLYEESMNLIEFSPVEDHIKKKEFSADHFLRLEWEAQFLRKAKPFYINSNRLKPSFSPDEEGRTVDEETVARLLKEAEAASFGLTTPSNNN